MLFAEISIEGWVAIITAICVGVGGIAANIATLILDYYREQAKLQRDLETAGKVEGVRRALYTETNNQNSKLDTIADDIHRVEKATNSMKDQLISATEMEALARGKEVGRVEEVDRVKALNPSPKPQPLVENPPPPLE